MNWHNGFYMFGGVLSKASFALPFRDHLKCKNGPDFSLCITHMYYTLQSMPKPLPSDDLSIIGMFKRDEPEHFYMHFAYDSTESAWGQGSVEYMAPEILFTCPTLTLTLPVH